MERKRIHKRIKLCGCGCGKPVNDKFVRGHNWRGKKRSEENRKRISESLKGKLSWMKGKKHTRGAIEKMSKAMSGINHPNFGKKRSKETRTKIAISLQGENHPNWRGGISCEPYCFAWSSKEFKDFIKERDGWKCQNPGCNHCSDHLPLLIHHINYNKKDCEPNNLITLCRSCNGKANTNRDYWKNFYNKIVAVAGVYSEKETSHT